MITGTVSTLSSQAFSTTFQSQRGPTQATSAAIEYSRAENLGISFLDSRA